MSIYLNLNTTNAVSPIIDIGPGRTKLLMQVTASSWGSAVAELKWNINEADGHWSSFPTAVTVSSSTTDLFLVSIFTVPRIRLEVTTADPTADDNALISYVVI